MAISYVTVGSIVVNSTTTTLTLTAPACNVDDILIATLIGKDNIDHSPPDGTWTEIGTQTNNTTAMTTSQWWKRATESGGNFNFTKATDNNIFFAGVISAWRGCKTTGSPIDATTPTVSNNASSDTVTYATFNPTETDAYVVAIGIYANDLTTAGSISGTDPTFTNRFDIETSTGSDCSFFAYSGTSTGAATGARSHSTTSSADAINQGWLFGLIVQGVTHYTITADSASFTETGTAAGLAKGYKVGATAASFTEAGTDAGLKMGYKVGAESGTFLETGTAATLRKIGTISVESGSFAETGTDVGLRRAFTLINAGNSYAHTGSDATLTYTQSGYILIAGGGAFSETGTDAGLRKASKLIADTVAFAHTGTAAGMGPGYRVGGGTGVFAETGTGATLRKTYTPLGASNGEYTMAGSGVSLMFGGYRIGANYGSFSMTGTSANLPWAKQIHGKKNITNISSGNQMAKINDAIYISL